MAVIDLAKKYAGKGLIQANIQTGKPSSRNQSIERLRLSKERCNNEEFTHKTASRQISVKDPKTRKVIIGPDGKPEKEWIFGKPVKPEKNFKVENGSMYVSVYFGKKRVKLYDDPTTGEPVYGIPCGSSKAEILAAHDELIGHLETGALDEELEALSKAAAATLDEVRDRKDPVKAAAQDAAKAARAAEEAAAGAKATAKASTK